MSNEFRNIRKILVIKLRHIGDVLLTVPVFRALKTHFPDAHVTALVNSGTEDAIRGHPLMDRIIVYDRGIKKLPVPHKYRAEILFLKQVRAEKFDMVIDLTSGDRAALIAFLSGAQYRIAQAPGRKGFPGKRYLYTHLAPANENCHAVLKNLNVLSRFGISTDNLTVDFFTAEDSRAFVRRIFSDNHITVGHKVVHVHPVSRLFSKCWRDEYMAEVIRWIVRRGARVVLTSSPAGPEIEKTRKILSLVAADSDRPGAGGNKKTRNNKDHFIVDLCGRTTIKDLAAVSEASSLFLGVDSAPMHIAAAVGTPVIALFGRSEKRWSPWGTNHVVISIKTQEKAVRKKQGESVSTLRQITPRDVIIELEKHLHSENNGT